MKFVDLLRQPITIITENDILKDIVFPAEPAQNIITKIITKSPEDILVVYVDDNKKVQGVITAFNVGAFLDGLQDKSEILDTLKVSELNWDKREDTWLRKSDSVESALVKLSTIKNENIFIVVDENDVYAGKVKRKNAVVKIHNLSD